MNVNHPGLCAPLCTSSISKLTCVNLGSIDLLNGSLLSGLSIAQWSLMPLMGMGRRHHRRSVFSAPSLSSRWYRLEMTFQQIQCKGYKSVRYQWDIHLLAYHGVESETLTSIGNISQIPFLRTSHLFTPILPTEESSRHRYSKPMIPPSILDVNIAPAYKYNLCHSASPR